MDPKTFWLPNGSIAANATEKVQWYSNFSWLRLISSIYAFANF